MLIDEPRPLPISGGLLSTAVTSCGIDLIDTSRCSGWVVSALLSVRLAGDLYLFPVDRAKKGACKQF